MKSYPQRKSPRLQGYDYAQEGAYFVTVCTHHRAHLFGEVVEAEMELNTLGCIAQTCWEAILAHFPHIELDAFVVMPNHVHGIVIIMGKPGGHVSDVSLPTPAAFGKPVKGALSSVMRSFKGAVTYQINQTLNTDKTPVWQGRFHEEIISSETALNNIRNYILTNPARWQEDELNSRGNKPRDATR